MPAAPKPVRARSRRVVKIGWGGAGDDTESEPDAEPEGLQPACLHDRDRRRERERAEPREQRI